MAACQLGSQAYPMLCLPWKLLTLRGSSKVTTVVLMQAGEQQLPRYGRLLGCTEQAQNLNKHEVFCICNFM